MSGFLRTWCWDMYYLFCIKTASKHISNLTVTSYADKRALNYRFNYFYLVDIKNFKIYI